MSHWFTGLVFLVTIEHSVCSWAALLIWSGLNSKMSKNHLDKKIWTKLEKTSSFRVYKWFMQNWFSYFFFRRWRNCNHINIAEYRKTQTRNDTMGKAKGSSRKARGKPNGKQIERQLENSSGCVTHLLTGKANGKPKEIQSRAKAELKQS